METKNKNSFNTVDFMRQVSNELSNIYHADKQRYHDELKKSMSDFLNTRKKPAAKKIKTIAASEAIH